MNNKELSLEISTNVKDIDKLKEYTKILERLDKIVEILGDAYTEAFGTLTDDLLKVMDSVEGVTKKQEKMTQGVQKTANSYKSLKYSINDALNSVKKSKDGFVDIFKTIPNFVDSTNKSISKFEKYFSNSMEYIEEQHLLEVAFGDTADEAKRFVNIFSETNNLDTKFVQSSTALFKQLSNALGLTNEQATTFSENLMQLTLDISSLYDISLEASKNKLRSVLAGRSTAVQSLGASTQIASLQDYIDQNKLDLSVSKLSVTEKRVLAITTLMSQLTEISGDWAKTMDEPSNQLKIIKEQLAGISRIFGDLFMPLIKAILPYITATIMAIKLLLDYLKTAIYSFYNLLGFDTSEETNSIKKTEEDFIDLGSSVDKASGAVKNFKKGLRGFDKLNNITSTSGTSGLSGITGVGLDPKIWKQYQKELDKYNKLLGSGSNKVKEIRDGILKWLGFTVEVNDETGELSLKFDKIKVGTFVLAGIVAGSLYKGFSKIFGVFSAIGKIKGVFGDLFGGKTKGIKKALDDTGSIGETITKRSKSFKIPSWKNFGRAMGEIGIIIVGITAVVAAYGALSKINGFKEFVTSGVDIMVKVFTGFSKILLPLVGATGVIVLLSQFERKKKDVKSFYVALGEVASIIAGMGIIAAAYAGIAYLCGDFAEKGVNLLVKTFVGLGDIFLPLVGLTALIVGLGVASSAGGVGFAVVGAGILTLAEIMGGLTILVAAYGGLAQIGGINDFVDSGIDLMVKIFGGIGKVIGSIVGNIVGSLVEEASKTLPTLGKSLSNFWNEITPFIEGVSACDEETFNCIEILAKSLLVLTTADLFNNLNIFKKIFGSGTFEEFGKQLSAFAPHFASFISTLREAEIDENILNVTEHIAKVIERFSKINLKNQGGLWQLIAGNEDFSDFAKQIKNLGKGIVDYWKEVKSINKPIVEVTENVAKVVERLAKVDVSNSGGLWQLIVGKNDLSNFGSQIKSLGAGFKGYYENIRGITDFKNSEKIISEIEKLADISKKIKDGGLKTTLSDFGASLKSSASSWKSYFSTNLSEKNGTTIGNDFAEAMGKAITDKLKKLKLPSIQIKGSGVDEKYEIKPKWAYANGGLPPVGQLFIANEKGPELVGHIGGQSFVANQEQMMDLLDKKIGQANKGLSNATIIVQVGSKEVAREVLTDLQGMAKANGRPIRIGG